MLVLSRDKWYYQAAQLPSLVAFGVAMVVLGLIALMLFKAIGGQGILVERKVL